MGWPPPFELLPDIDAKQRAAVEAEALRLNDRYLIDFIEAHAFCPFARESRQRGETRRIVHYFDSADPAPLFAHMAEVAADPTTIVTQIIFPALEADPRQWAKFCHELTRRGHERIGGPAVLAVAPLHPTLTFQTTNPFALLTLFRRTPDPTIQWVRLDALDAIYEGKRTGTVVLSPAEIARILADPQPKRDLYDRIAETNLATAERLGYDQIVAQLAAIADEGRQNYRRILDRKAT